MHILHRRLRSSRESLTRLAFQDVRSRLAGQLLDLVRRQGDCQGDRAELATSLTHQDLANLIGSTRETTTATLNQLRRARLIQFDRRRIVIPHLPGLEALATG
jgi:CRP/FNR family transcriptional regulator